MKELYHSLGEKWQLRKKRKARQRATNKRKQSRPIPYSIMPSFELFDSIKNLVMCKWDEIHETGNISILLKTETQNATYKVLHYCRDTWDDINEQWATKFGMSFDFKAYWAKKAEVAALEIVYALSENNWDLMLMNLAKDELELIRPKGKPNSMNDALIIEKDTGIKLNLQTDSVYKFYSATKLHQKLASNG